MLTGFGSGGQCLSSLHFDSACLAGNDESRLVRKR